VTGVQTCALPIYIGTTVNIQFDDDEDELETYQIVGKQEVNVDDNKISFVSPIGKGIMHKKVGHTATVIAPAGSYTVKIISISIRSEERRVGKECRSRWWRYH